MAGWEAMTEGAMRENLLAAGCDRETAEQVLALEAEGAHQEAFRLLSVQRRRLLDRLHRAERRIDCLDYLIFQLQKKHSSGPLG